MQNKPVNFNGKHELKYTVILRRDGGKVKAEMIKIGGKNTSSKKGRQRERKKNDM